MQQDAVNKLAFEHCALCGEQSVLQASHIIPRFVFEWQRKTSATGHIRSSQNPNLRVQDGPKPRMLCSSCEQLFSSWEKKFSEECFVRLNNGTVNNVPYGPWMLKFSTSVSWRILRLFSAIDCLAGFPEHIKTSIDSALHTWSQFLLGDKSNPGPHQQHMFMIGDVDNTSYVDTPHNINRYLSRAVEIHVDHTEDSAITYAKMGRFILFGFIVMNCPRRWKGTKLHVQHGQFGIHDIELPTEAVDFIFGRARLTAKRQSQISGRQRARIRKSYEQLPGHVDRSETFRAMRHDVSLFGQDAFVITQPDTADWAKKRRR